jgi:hypothetical protein
MDFLIQKFLENKNIIGINAIDYILQDDGLGAYIKTWDLDIKKPDFSSEYFLDLIKQIDACETLEELNAININFE